MADEQKEDKVLQSVGKASFGGRTPGQSRAERNGNGSGDNGHSRSDMTNLEEEAMRYTDLTVGRASLMGYWVECTLGAYKGLYVKFRTNNRTSMLRMRPTYDTPPKVRANEREMMVLRSLQQDEPPEGASVEEITAFFEKQDEINTRLNELAAESNELTRPLLDDLYKRQAHWLSRYATDFDPWPFTDVEKPDPSNPDSYLVLHEELEDLWMWCMSEGYDKALALSAKNS